MGRYSLGSSEDSALLGRLGSCVLALAFASLSGVAVAEEEEAEFEGVAEVEARYTRRAPRGRTLREKGNGDCVFYDREQGCTVYPVRPPQCRTWPFWASNVATPDDWQQTCEICPGSGRGIRRFRHRMPRP